MSRADRASGTPSRSSPDTARAPDSELEPYLEAAALAERELELAQAGEVAMLADMAGRWRELRGQIARPHPSGAGPLLAIASSFSERAGIELLHQRERLLQALGTTTRASRAAQGYGAQMDSAGGLDRRA